MMHTKRIVAESELDREWLDLIMQAKELGLRLEEVRHFLKQNEISSAPVEEEMELKHV